MNEIVQIAPTDGTQAAMAWQDKLTKRWYATTRPLVAWALVENGLGHRHVMGLAVLDKATRRVSIVEDSQFFLGYQVPGFASGKDWNELADELGKTLNGERFA